MLLLRFVKCLEISIWQCLAMKAAAVVSHLGAPPAAPVCPASAHSAWPAAAVLVVVTCQSLNCWQGCGLCCSCLVSSSTLLLHSKSLVVAQKGGIFLLETITLCQQDALRCQVFRCLGCCGSAWVQTQEMQRALRR